MTYLVNLLGVFLEAFFQLWGGVARIVAPLIGAALILLIGWSLAIFLGRLIGNVLGENNIPWNRILSRVGIATVLKERLSLSSNAGALIGWLVKWFLIITSFMAAMTILQLGSINLFIGEAMTFLPFAFTAAMIVFLGFFLGGLSDQILTRLIGAIGIKGDIAGLATRWIIIAFGILAAARYLNLQLELLWPKFLDFLVVAGAIAVGLGFSSRAGEWFERIKVRLNIW